MARRAKKSKAKSGVLNPESFGLACGTMWGLIVLIMTIVSIYTGYATQLLNLVGSIYPGYAISITGAMIGLVYGFIDGFIGGYLFIWLYNGFEKKKFF